SSRPCSAAGAAKRSICSANGFLRSSTRSSRRSACCGSCPRSSAISAHSRAGGRSSGPSLQQTRCYTTSSRTPAPPLPTRATRRHPRNILPLWLPPVDEDGKPMSDQELRDEILTLLLAGHETTATALAWAVEEIVRRPEVCARILDEVAASPSGASAPLPY